MSNRLVIGRDHGFGPIDSRRTFDSKIRCDTGNGIDRRVVGGGDRDMGVADQDMVYRVLCSPDIECMAATGICGGVGNRASQDRMHNGSPIKQSREI